MKKQTIINFLKETAALITYCLIINVVLATFYLITDYINLFYLIDLGTNVGYIIGYTMIMCVVLSLSILIEPYNLLEVEMKDLLEIISKSLQNLTIFLKC